VEDRQDRCMLHLPNGEGTCIINLPKSSEGGDTMSSKNAHSDQSRRGSSGCEEYRNAERLQHHDIKLEMSRLSLEWVE
jgi:hypothetical protein